MAFFDNLTKKVSEATQSVVQKGKDFTDIAKLNASISDEEKKIDTLYKTVGKHFVEKIGDRAEGTFAEYVAEIKASEAKIAEFKNQIKELKGVTSCPKCGADITAEALFCNSCGAKIEKAAHSTPTSRSCLKCGAALPDDAIFCNSCGTKVEKAEEQPAPEANACPQCGAKVTDDAIFCNSCGTKLK